MRNAIPALALILCCSCQAQTTSRQRDAGSQAVSGPGTTSSSMLVNRVWMRSDSTGPPGVMRIFLSDGTLLIDSCWETYRLEKWRWESDSTIVWREDTAEIVASVVELGPSDLVLRLKLTGGNQVQHFQIASVPYLCQDMKR